MNEDSEEPPLGAINNQSAEDQRWATPLRSMEAVRKLGILRFTQHKAGRQKQ